MYNTEKTRKGVPLIIVEGLDNTGKTTLVEQISKAFPELRVRESIGNKHDLTSIATQAGAETMRSPVMDHTLTDRSRLISEWVYNPILKQREMAFSFEEWLHHLQYFVKSPQLIIHCTRPLYTVANGWDQREQLEGVLDHLAELDEAYNRIMVMMNFLLRLNGQPRKVVRYDYELTPWTLIEARVRNYLKEVS